MLIEYRANGQRREVANAIAEQLIARRVARAVVADAAPAQQYQTRMLTARPNGSRDPAAPYGYKADGTPRKRPAPPPRQKKD